MVKLWSKRVLLVIAFSVIFELVLKPFRLFIVYDLLVPLAIMVQAIPSNFQIYPGSYVGFNVVEIDIKNQNPSEWLGYSGFGNLFFFIGGSIMILLGLDWKKIIWLFMLHFFLSLIAGLFLLLGLWTNVIYWLYAMDFTVAKAYPAATGMYVLMQKRET